MGAFRGFRAYTAEQMIAKYGSAENILIGATKVNKPISVFGVLLVDFSLYNLMRPAEGYLGDSVADTSDIPDGVFP